MSIMWSGPGKALEEHLALYEKVQRVRTFIGANIDRDMRISQLPPLVNQRMLLVSSMSNGVMVDREELGGGISIDGFSPGLSRDDPNFTNPSPAFDRACALIGNENKMLNEGETHYVSHHVKELVEQAAAQASDEPLFPTDLPCPAGLIVLEHPLILNDLHPETGEVVEGLHMPTRMIGWRKHTVWATNNEGGYDKKDGIFYVCYTDSESYRALHVPAVQKLLVDEDDDLVTISGDKLSAQGYMDRIGHSSKTLGVWAIDFSGWAFGMGWHRAGDGHRREDFAKGEIHDNVAILRRFLLAYFRFTWQRILVPTKPKLNRAELRRAERIRKMPMDGYVKVMRLRRHVEMEARGEKVDAGSYAYDFAWITRGHPRRQHYATLGPARNPDGSFNEDSHRLIWIEPYLKGNPDGPIIRGHNVTAAVR